MTIKSVSYCTSQKLSCCAPQSVYLCLQNVELVGAACGVESTIENETYERSTIAATVASVVHKSNCVYEYTFHYNTEDIVDEIVLKSSNITGVICDGCVIKLIEDTFGNEPFIDVDIETGAYYFVSNHGCRYELPTSVAGITVQDTASVDLTLAGTVLSADVIISNDVGNQLEERVDGLYVPASGGGSITVSDTASVDLTLTGSNLEADVIISPDALNQLEERPNGLYANPNTVGFIYQSYTPTLSGATLNFNYHSWYANNGERLEFNYQLDITAPTTSFFISLPPGFTGYTDAGSGYYIQAVPGMLFSPGGLCQFHPCTAYVGYAGNSDKLEVYSDLCQAIGGPILLYLTGAIRVN